MAVTEAFDQIRNSSSFSKVMTLILSIGNYMNSGSRNAESIGFEINYLNKVSNFFFCVCVMVTVVGNGHGNTIKNLDVAVCI